MESSARASLTGTERRTTPVELLWDLAFVYAITQVTHFLLFHLTWGGFLRGMILLALIWWAWSAFVWAANAQEEDSGTMQLALLASLVLIFIAGLAVPQAFGDEAVLFALTYSGVRLIHLALYVDASRRGNASWESIVRLRRGDAGGAGAAGDRVVLRPRRGRPRSGRWRWRSTTQAPPGSPALACAGCSRSPSPTSPSATASS